MSNGAAFARLLIDRVSSDLGHQLNDGSPRADFQIAQPTAALAGVLQSTFLTSERRGLLANSYDFALTLLADSKVQHAVQACGLDVETTVADLRSVLSTWNYRVFIARVRWRIWLMRGGEPWSSCLLRSIAGASWSATLAGRREYDLLHAVAGLWYADSSVPWSLQRHGTRLEWIRSYISHGVAVQPTSELLGDALTAQRVMVRVHTDEFTPAEYLAGVFRDLFEHPEPAKVANQVLASRSAAIGPLDRNDALKLIAIARQQAADFCYPLRFTLERGDADHISASDRK